jgi:uncharacterized membrane protein YphA (DoxX/SURF4 family)
VTEVTEGSAAGDETAVAAQATEQTTPPPAEVEHAQEDAAVVRWKLSTRIAFRFFFVYFGLFCLGTAQIAWAYVWVGVNFVPPWLVRWISLSPPVEWVAGHVFHTSAEGPTGSGDQRFDWVSLLCWLVVAAAVTLCWSVLDRRRPNYATLYKWFRLVIRFALAGQMMSYGVAKAIPLQMPFPSLVQLLQPFGNFPPMEVLWTQVGSSPPYEIALGCVEVLGGLLLLLPRTTTLGAVVCAAATAQVFLLNMTFDVPVKILSFHLLLFSLFLLAPQARRLATFFLSSGPVGASIEPQLFTGRRANRIAVVGQVVLGLWMLGTQLFDGWTLYHQIGPDQAKPPLYGIWNVAEFTFDGRTRPPVLTDKLRWRRVIFDAPGVFTFQHMDDSLGGMAATVSTDRHVIDLRLPDGSQIGTLTFSQPAADRLVLDGRVKGRTLHARLERVDIHSFSLVNCGFHWVQPQPYFCG